jgi:transposase InsO family protein
MKRDLCQSYRGRATQKELHNWLCVARSTGYYRSSGKKRGCKPSTHTLRKDGSRVSNQEVVDTLIKEVFSQEFNRYGYQLSTEELRSMEYIINPKKTYRLMSENGLLLERLPKSRSKRQWVEWRKIRGVLPLEHLCMDIKYVYIHGDHRNAYLLAITDVATRYVIGWTLNYSMKHTHVILCLHQALQGRTTNKLMLRTDNGSQFIAHGLRKYCELNDITQEFTHIATPEENAYAESLFSCIEREVIQPYEFSSIFYARGVFDRYFTWHNTKRRRHALGRKSPLEYWNTEFHSHPVKPPTAERGGFVKGDDTFKIIKNTSSLVSPLTNPERELSLLNQDENMNENVLNHFAKSVQKIRG